MCDPPDKYLSLQSQSQSENLQKNQENTLSFMDYGLIMLKCGSKTTRLMTFCRIKHFFFHSSSLTLISEQRCPKSPFGLTARL